jgi:hypothetical protein
VTSEAVNPTADEHIHIISHMEKENVTLRAQLAELQKMLHHSKAAQDLPSTSELGGAFMGTPQSASRPPPRENLYSNLGEPPNPFMRSSSVFETMSANPGSARKGYDNPRGGIPPVQNAPGAASHRDKALEEENRALVEQLGKAEMQRRVAQAESRAAGIDAEALRRRLRSLENESEEYRLQATGLEQKAAELQQRVWDLEAVLDRTVTGSAVKKSTAEARLQGHVEQLERELEEAARREKMLSDRVLGLEGALAGRGTDRVSARKIQALEGEIRGLREKEREFETAVAALNHEHAMKLKQKDDFIRQVMKERKSDGHGKWGASGKEDVRLGGETPTWCKIPRARGVNARANSPPLATSPGREPVMGSAGKKRTFWDITNTAASPTQNGRKRAQLVAKSAPVLTFSVRSCPDIPLEPLSVWLNVGSIEASRNFEIYARIREIRGRVRGPSWLQNFASMLTLSARDHLEKPFSPRIQLWSEWAKVSFPKYHK